MIRPRNFVKNLASLSLVLAAAAPASALVVCAKDDGTGQPKPKSKLSIETACTPGKKVEIGIAYDPSTATVDLSTTRVTGDLSVEAGNVLVTGDLSVDGGNLQVTSGVGATDGVPNGKGNLIVGYNEASYGQTQTGSHNIVVGKEHEYTSFGGLVAGDRNTISGQASSVTGGSLNRAIGNFSSIGGGGSNVAMDPYSSVGGGASNTARGTAASVAGGYKNLADGDWSAVGGGNSVSSTVNFEWHAGQVVGFPTGTKY